MENNPYDILGVSPAASRAEIVRAVAVAMRSRQYPVDVIAKAQKSLLRDEERILADYLRPILPTVKRFKSSDLSALNQSVPTLVLLSEFDELESAITSSAAEENLEWEPLSMSPPELLAQGKTACRDGHYSKGVKYLEVYCQSCPDHYTKDYIEAQMSLVRAYQENGQDAKAITLCQQMTNHSDSQVQAWANNTLPLLFRKVSHV